MQQVVKILVIRFSSIGDIVLTTPVLRCLKNQLDGEVEIHYLTKKQYKSIVDSNPNVSKVYTIEKSTNEIIADLKNEGYDYIVDLHKNLRSKRVIKKLKCLSFSFEKLNYQKWLMTSFKINKLPNIHIVERYLNAVKYLGVENDGVGLEYYIPTKDKVDVNTLPSNFKNGYVSFAIGAQHATKCLPEHKIISICKQLQQPVVLLGGKEDAEKAERIVKAVGANVFNACGKFNLNQSASLVQQSKVLITHDTGLMHIGAALGIKIVSVWGNTIPEFGMYPYYPTQPEKFVMIENKNLNCRPCSKIGYDKCPKKHFKCMEDIAVSEVVKSTLQN
ncbi:glycosyltransferase family 9 protein [Vicingus serpentipes]|uniref:Glycosyltransferase family 9 protein n=1 Tax=Vicingus serpentipes TaxID=1926625 RepID=A0A5C6RYA2_9FLAO|nr:glycosyltransferase family 9 protein [Vicingus serpentipes]